ncbi:hypothetical protein [Pantoea agglomerans]|uniref:hypothetical protein n=1 Tax=Enterobacter agglomerans TaxID=549 RepID=UPI00068DC0ED|nr:hypothetical protein [Pantoea agglomerans]
MAGGFWGKGENPFWNHDSDAALNDKQKLDAEADAFRARLDSEDSNHRAVQAQQRATSVIRQRDELVLELKNQKTVFFYTAMKSNILQGALEDLIAKNPHMADEILDTIQANRDKCNMQDYRQKWWDWIFTSELTPEMNYLKFPFDKRELKKN